MSLLVTPKNVTRVPVPAQAGIGLKFDHITEIIETQPAAAWFEIHAENFMSAGGPSIRALDRVRRHYPMSVHGVGLSLGGAGPLDQAHLDRLKSLVKRIEPGLVSEHLAWCRTDGDFLNDLLPVPYERQALATVIDHVNQTQDTLGRTILIENPSLYVRFRDTHMSEPAFLNEVARATGCGLLLDINNVYVSASNLRFDAEKYLRDIDKIHVGEIHLAGHHVRFFGEEILRIDDHGSPVSDEVWALYKKTLKSVGPVPTLIEWDTNIPPLGSLLAQADHAQKILTKLSNQSSPHAPAH